MYFEKFVTTPVFQNTTGRLLLIAAVSIKVKERLVNQSVNYDTAIKVYHFEPGA